MFALIWLCRYGFEKGCLDAGCAAQPPHHARQSKHQLALDGRFGVVVGNHRGFEGLVILGILGPRNDGLGGQPVADSITDVNARLKQTRNFSPRRYFLIAGRTEFLHLGRYVWHKSRRSRRSRRSRGSKRFRKYDLELPKCLPHKESSIVCSVAARVINRYTPIEILGTTEVKTSSRIAPARSFAHTLKIAILGHAHQKLIIDGCIYLELGVRFQKLIDRGLRIVSSTPGTFGFFLLRKILDRSIKHNTITADAGQRGISPAVQRARDGVCGYFQGRPARAYNLWHTSAPAR